MSGHAQTAMASPWDMLLRCKSNAVRFDRSTDADALPASTKASRVRELLRQNGPMSAAAICMEVEYPNTGLVSASLKYDVASGRITFFDGKYELNPAWDEDLHRRINGAKTLLKRHGFSVTRIER